jgi:uracil phosphoribosyltransferase
VTVVSHPLVQHKLTLMRRKDASTNTFRTLLNELSMLMAYEVTRDMPVQLVEIETPLETMNAPVIDGKKLVFVSILRAGNGILEGMLSVVPGARVGHIGLYRDPQTRTCPSSQRPSTVSSTITATSCRGWVMRATASSALNRLDPSQTLPGRLSENEGLHGLRCADTFTP